MVFASRIHAAWVQTETFARTIPTARLFAAVAFVLIVARATDVETMETALMRAASGTPVALVTMETSAKRILIATVDDVVGIGFSLGGAMNVSIPTHSPFGIPSYLEFIFQSKDYSLR